MREQVKTHSEPVSFFFSDHKVDIEESIDGVLFNAHIYRLLGGNDYPMNFAYVTTVTGIAPEEAGEKARQSILSKLTL
jgi:hypothetical protein